MKYALLIYRDEALREDPGTAEFDEMMRRLREYRHQDVEELEAIRDLMIDAGGPAEEARKRVEELIVRYRDSVKMD